MHVSQVHEPKYLQSCPQCRIRDVKEFGEAYWHRIHQIPGISVCPSHGVPLQRAISPAIKSTNSRSLVPSYLTPSEASWTPLREITPTKLYFRFIGRVIRILKGEEIVDYSPPKIHAGLDNLGFTRGKLVLRTELAEYCRLKYGAQMFDLYQLPRTHRLGVHLRKIIAGREINPFKALLIYDLLDLSVNYAPDSAITRQITSYSKSRAEGKGGVTTPTSLRSLETQQARKTKQGDSYHADAQRHPPEHASTVKNQTEQISGLIHKIASQIREAPGKPTRITRSLIMRKMTYQERKVLSKNITARNIHEALAETTESVVEIAIRRIKWAKTSIEFDTRPSFWYFCYRAGVRGAAKNSSAVECTVRRVISSWSSE